MARCTIFDDKVNGNSNLPRIVKSRDISKRLNNKKYLQF